MTSALQRSDQEKGHLLLRRVWTALALPALADTLGLTGRQVEELSRLKEKVKGARQAHRKRMDERREALADLFAPGEMPNSQEVRRHLTEGAARRAHYRGDLYERALEMREVLTEGQREVLAHLTLRDLRCQVRRHTTIADEQEIEVAAREISGPGLPDRTPATEESAKEAARPKDVPRASEHRALDLAIGD